MKIKRNNNSVRLTSYELGWKNVPTFCRCIMLSRSPKGDSSGVSKARRASVLSISVRQSRLSSPCSASCVWANSSADSVSLSLINSIKCCCCKRGNQNKAQVVNVEVQALYNIKLFSDFT